MPQMTNHTIVTGESELTSRTVPTPDGPFTVLEDDASAVVASGWSDDVRAVLRQARIADDWTVRAASSSSPATDAVEAYYSGDLAAIDTLNVHQSGTELQHAVWDQLRRIPIGLPLTYSQLADKIGRPQAFRAVAGACARNSAALFVPCHRVIAASGSLAGFAWGVETKSSLLAREAGHC